MIPADIFKHLNAERAPRDPGCGGRGYHRSWDTDYDCRGCAACWWPKRLVYTIVDAAKLTAAEEQRAQCEVAVVAYRALQSIGRAIAAALSPGAGVQSLVRGAVKEWNTVRKGRWYQVDGKRGNARHVFGSSGHCMGVYTEERRSQYGTWSYGSTTKAALKIEGQEKLVYVTIANLAPIVEPTVARTARLEAEAQKTRQALQHPVFPADLAGKRGAVGCIVGGPHAGKRGRVFWHGMKGNSPRVGVKLCACKKRCSCEVAWCSAHEVVPAQPAGAALRPVTVRDVDGETHTIGAFEIAEQQALTLLQAGFETEAEHWFHAARNEK